MKKSEGKWKKLEKKKKERSEWKRISEEKSKGENKVRGK